MKKQFLIYQFEIGKDRKVSLKLPEIQGDRSFRLHLVYHSVQDAEKEIERQEAENMLQGNFVILPVYYVEID